MGELMGKHAKPDILTIEVGSTLTKLIAFGAGRILARAISLTTPADVMAGVERAMSELAAEHGIDLADAGAVFATSSAAGGLRMTVHGLTRDLTTMAAEEAALGAGANVKLITAGPLTERDERVLRQIAPNLIMLAGGVEYGAEDIVLANAKRIAALALPAPVVYAGNVTLREEVQRVFEQAAGELIVVENVYPRFDELNVGPVRAVIQRLFAERLTIAPGTDRLRELCKGEILPVPGACLRAAELLADRIGDLVVVDVGGATTDVHSVIDTPSAGNVDPQIRARRTVEGDLGLFVSAQSVWEKLGRQGQPDPLNALPLTDAERAVSAALAGKAAELALLRHAGRTVPGAVLPGGKQAVRGRDLRSAKTIVGTGGGLAGLPGGLDRLREALRDQRRDTLMPPPHVAVHTDRDYVFSACGAFCGSHPDAAFSLMRQSLGI